MQRLGAAGLAWFGVLLGSLSAQPASAQDTTGSAMLVVEVPEDAKVQINGNPTSATGAQRKFADRGLQPGFDYEYVVRVQVVREGRTLEQVKTVRLQAGQTARVVFRFPAGPEAKPKEKSEEPTLAPKPKEKEKPPGWQPIEPVPAKKGPSSTQTTTPLPPAKPSGSGKQQAGPTSPPLEGPGVGSPEKKPAGSSKGKPSDVKPPAKDGKPTTKGADLTGPQKGGKPAAVVPKVIVHKTPPVEKYLVEGRLAEAEQSLTQWLKGNSPDDVASVSLGAVQFLRAVERLSQSLYRHGFSIPPVKIEGLDLSLVRLPFPRNPKPQALSYHGARDILKEFVSDLEQAEATLAQVRNEEVKLPLHVGLIRIDLAGDGNSADEVWQTYAKLSGRPNLRPLDAQTFLICFDYGDVLWLRAYCHLLAAAGNVVLAYDEQDLFEGAGNLVFAKPVSPQAMLVKDPEKLRGPLDSALVDALKHLVKFKLQESERMPKALEHLRTALDLSRKSWKAILAETDDDFEWIPNPNQRSQIPGLAVKQEMVEAWLKSVDEADAILTGNKLAPSWIAGPPGSQSGLNVNLIFTRPPTTFDLIFWIQGIATEPYLQDGTLTDPKLWRRLKEVFGANFLNYLLWFN